MGDVAKVIALDDVRASQKHQALRPQLHERFDQWLDALACPFPEAELTWHQVRETIWGVRQPLTASVAQTIVEHRHQAAHRRTSRHCATGARLLPARPTVRRTSETLVGAIELARPYVYCRQCPCGRSPLDEVVGLRVGRRQLDGQQAAGDLATALPYETASTLFGRLRGIPVRRERRHPLIQQVAAGLRVLEVAPSREAIERRVAPVAAGRCRRPVLLLGIEGASVPSRPASARGRRPGQARPRARRARWQHAWRAAKGVRFSLREGERIVQVRSGHQGQNEHALGEAVQQGKDAGLLPEEAVRLWVVCAGAEWRWQHVQALVPKACPGLDS